MVDYDDGATATLRQGAMGVAFFLVCPHERKWNGKRVRTTWEGDGGYYPTLELAERELQRLRRHGSEKDWHIMEAVDWHALNLRLNTR